MKLKHILSVSLLLLITGCDGVVGKIKSLGSSATITCYSGEKQIFKGQSTGKVSSEAESDGYYFVRRSDNRLVEVSGNCIIEYNN